MEQTGAAFDIETALGLTSREAEERLFREGPNELATDRRASFWHTIREIVSEPMILLLLSAGILYALLGDLAEALTLLAFVLLVIGIEIVQERKTERALSALKGLTSPRALVIRDGVRKRVPGREVVRGDLVLLAEGDRIPADARLLDANNLEADESLLTGESLPVRKRAARGESSGTPGGDDQPFVYAGSLVVRGRGAAEVVATGAQSEIGKIGTSLGALESEATPLEREVKRVVRTVAIVGLALCLLLFVVYGLTRGHWLEGLLAGIALAMGVLPEEFPVVLTVFLALGALRIAKSNVLTRRMPAIETLGAASVLCTDKTGTLTENRMHVARFDTGALVYAPEKGPLPEEVHELLEMSILASQRDPFDPMEIAFKRLGEDRLQGTEHLHASWELLREYPLSPSLLSMSQVWRAPDGTALVIAAKGAPEAIFDLCHLPEAELARWRTRVESLAREGLRVLAVARAEFADASLPPQQHDFDFRLLGLVGLEDPLREKVPAAIEECRRAGMRVIMITGDYPETARAIAARAGLALNDDVMTGSELQALDDRALAEKLSHVQVIARAVPELKLRIVRALSQQGEVVAMTGDGVNDAPALKAAQIGIAMGGRGTDVAREAAALIITDDDFSSIVDAVRLGRRIFDNLQKAMAYVIAVHVPVAGMSLLPVLFGLPLALFPVHIVFLELMVDPICSIAFEAEPAEPDIMRRPPRAPSQGLFERKVLLVSLLQGSAVLVATLAVFAWTLSHGALEAHARALAFACLIAANVSLVLVNRSWTQSALAISGARNIALWVVLGGAMLALSAALRLPAARTLFHFAPVPAASVLWATTAGVVSVAWFELIKRFAPSLLPRRCH